MLSGCAVWADALPAGRFSVDAQGELSEEPLAAADDVEAYRAKFRNRVGPVEDELHVLFAGGVPTVDLHEDVPLHDALSGR